MSMNGIDISNWQKGINLAAVPGDFVIMKVTEGTGYVSPDFRRQYEQAKAAGKCLGVYHYANGGDVAREADHFLRIVGNRVGEAILVLDWESQNNVGFGKNDFAWCKSWLDYVARKTGVRPMLYISQAEMYKFNGLGDYGLWIAQYANMKATGYQDKPWREGTYVCAIRQYSSCGRLVGYNGNLDLNKAYMDRNGWNKCAGRGNEMANQTAAPAPTPAAQGSASIAELQAECNRQGFSAQKIDGIAGPITLAGCPMVKKGAKGNITKWIQNKLNSLGYNCGAADGIFGQNTKNAVIAYQKAKGLTVDGIVGPKTWSKLLGLS